MKFFALISSFICAVFFVVISSGACKGSGSASTPEEETRQQPPLVCTALDDATCENEVDCKLINVGNCDDACNKVAAGDCGDPRADCQINVDTNVCEDKPAAAVSCNERKPEECIDQDQQCKLLADNSCTDICENVPKKNCLDRNDCELIDHICQDKVECSKRSSDECVEKGCKLVAGDKCEEKCENISNDDCTKRADCSMIDSECKDRVELPAATTVIPPKTQVVAEPGKIPLSCEDVPQDQCNGTKFVAEKLCIWREGKCSAFVDSDTCNKIKNLNQNSNKQACKEAGCVVMKIKKKESCRPDCSKVAKEVCAKVKGCQVTKGNCIPSS